MSNLFLESLGEAEYDALRPYLEKIELPDRFVLHRGGETIEYCYFPVRGTSLCELVGLADGSEVEAGIIGREGFAGVTALLPGSIAPNMFIVQIPGAAMRIKAKILREQARRRPALLERILVFSVALGVQVSQTAVCNARHNLSERLARWLLMLQDRAERDELPLTHDILSTMLGVRRSGVTVAAGGLSERGAIRYTRGLVTIIDRQRLEAASCECYRAMRERQRLLLGEDAPFA